MARWARVSIRRKWNLCKCICGITISDPCGRRLAGRTDRALSFPLRLAACCGINATRAAASRASYTVGIRLSPELWLRSFCSINSDATSLRLQEPVDGTVAVLRNVTLERFRITCRWSTVRQMALWSVVVLPLSRQKGAADHDRWISFFGEEHSVVPPAQAEWPGACENQRQGLLPWTVRKRCKSSKVRRTRRETCLRALA